MLVSTSVNAQIMGNYRYNNSGSYQQGNSYQPENGPISNAQTNPNELNIQVNGLINIIADQFVAVFNIVQVGETADSTESMMNTRVKRFIQFLKYSGIDESAVRLDMLSFVPKFGLEPEHRFSRTFNEIPAGYELQKNIMVHYKNSTKLDDIVSAAAEAEIYDLIKVEHYVTNMEKYTDSLRLKCIQELKQKSRNYETLGFRLDTMKKTMSDNMVSVYPDSRYYSYQAFSRPSMNAVKRRNPVVNEIEKTNSRFYAPIDGAHYDVVINPVISEPVIQVSYTIAMKYILKDPEVRNNQFYVVDNTGQPHQLRLN